MTFSIAAWDFETGMTGVAVTTKFLAVGSLCPFAKAGVGAVATQAFVNPTFGPRGLDLLSQGLAAQDVLEILLKYDEGREHRQLHVVDNQGRTAGFTGAENVEWAGNKTFNGFSVAGNMLVGEATIDATAEAYRSNMNQPFAERMMRAIEAGQAAGGDKRGRQSAALYIVSTEVYPLMDFRVDDHPDPVAELRRIFEESRKEYMPFKAVLPTAAQPAGVYEKEALEAILQKQIENDRLRTQAPN